MSENQIKVYKERWIVLFLFLFINVTMQLLWLSFAAISSQAQIYYGVHDSFLIDLFALSFMIMYIPLTFVSTWVIDKYDFKIGASIGAILAGVFGFLRFMAFQNYILALIFQIGIASGQPFILNSVTRLSANWFPESERTTATGVSMLAQFLGIMLSLIITQIIVVKNELTVMLLIFGILPLISGFLFIYFVRSKPPTPPSSEISTEKVKITEGLGKLVKNGQFIILLIAFFIVLGIFNTILTLIEGIVKPRGYLSIAGFLGGAMLLGGIIGSIIFSILSDKFKKSKVLLIVASLISTISIYALSFASEPISLYLSCFFFGFGVLAAAPVALEYAVKITKPVPEASSNGMLMMVGQVGGIILILVIELFFTDLTLNVVLFPALIIQAVLYTIVLISLFFLKKD